MEPKLILEFYLLSLNPKTGNYINLGSEFSYGILGSILMDLFRLGKIKFQSKSLVVFDPSTTNYVFFDKTIEILKRKKSASVSNLIVRMGFKNTSFKKEVIKTLLHNKHIVQIRKTFLGIPYNRYYPKSYEIRLSLIRRIRDILLRHEKPTSDELMLLSLIHVCRLYRSLSDIRQERALLKNNMKKLLKNGYAHSSDFMQIKELELGLRKAIMSSHAVTITAT